MGLLTDLRDRMNKIRIAATGNTSASAPQVPVVPGLGTLEVVNTNVNPTNSNIPGSWSRSWLGPGQPFSMGELSARDKDAETEPRSFQYLSSVNSTRSPRLAYGLTPFNELRVYAETVPEVSMCLRILTEEMKSFVPKIVMDNDSKVDNTGYEWMTEHPDGVNPWPVWLSRFLYNVLVYDAGCSYLVRNSRNKVVATRVVDGSSIFVLIDERGEQPLPPAPAFQQIIWGTPMTFLNTRQLWYKPRHLRADAPYGRSPIEDAMPAVKLLSQLWDYEYQKYIIGNIPEIVITVPENWNGNADQILEYEEAFNARMSGSNQERARARFLPAGMQVLQTKELTFNRESYDAATNSVRMAFGILQSEVGDAPSGGLGGSGYAEAMQSAFYRMGLAPLMAYVESHFNDIIKANGKDGIKFKLDFPSETLDPQKEEEKFSTRFQIGGITRDEYRQGVGMEPMGGEEGEFIVSPGGGGGEEGDMGEDPFGGMGGKQPPQPGGKPNPVEVRRPVQVLRKPLSVARKPVGVYNKMDSGLEAMARRLGWDGDMQAFEEGFKEEHEHAHTVENDEETMARIAIDHLMEDPDYYSKLTAALAKASGVDEGDDLYYGASINVRNDVEMPAQGANESLIISIGGDGVDSRPAVWKPVSGEDAKLQGWVGGKLFARSEAVYLLDRELAPSSDCYLVPVTYTAEIDGEPGSIQHYVSGRQPRAEVSEYRDRHVEQAAVIDYITGQVDRNRKNWLTHPYDKKRPVLIDSDLSFPVDPHQHLHSSFIDAWAGKKLSERMYDMLYLIIGNHDLWDDLREVLDSNEAVDNAYARAKQLYETRTIPLSDSVEVVDNTEPVGSGQIKVVRNEQTSEPDSGQMIEVVREEEPSGESEPSDEELLRMEIAEEMYEAVGKNYLTKWDEAEELAGVTYLMLNPDAELSIDTDIPDVYYAEAHKFVLKADWAEDKHPRDDDGKFAPKGGGSSGGGSADEPEAEASPAMSAPAGKKAGPPGLDDYPPEFWMKRSDLYNNGITELYAWARGATLSGSWPRISELLNESISSSIDGYEQFTTFGKKLKAEFGATREQTVLMDKYRIRDRRLIMKYGSALPPKPVKVTPPEPTPEPTPEPPVPAGTSVDPIDAEKVKEKNKVVEEICKESMNRAVVFMEDKNDSRGGMIFSFDEIRNQKQGYVSNPNKVQALKDFFEWFNTKADAYEAKHGLKRAGGSSLRQRFDAASRIAEVENNVSNKMAEIEAKDWTVKVPAKDIDPHVLRMMLGESKNILNPKATARVGWAGPDTPVGGISESYVVDIKGDGRALLKPDSIHGGAKNEVFSSNLNDALNMNVVPVTTAVDYNGKWSSIQSWCEGCERGFDLPDDSIKGGEQFVDSFSQMCVLDAITGNYDRHGGNWLYDPQDDRLVAIDNGKAGLAVTEKGWSASKTAGRSVQYVQENWRNIVQHSGGRLKMDSPIKEEHIKAAEEYVESKDFEALAGVVSKDKSAINSIREAAREGIKALRALPKSF